MPLSYPHVHGSQSTALSHQPSNTTQERSEFGGESRITAVGQDRVGGSSSSATALPHAQDVGFSMTREEARLEGLVWSSCGASWALSNQAGKHLRSLSFTIPQGSLRSRFSKVGKSVRTTGHKQLSSLGLQPLPSSVLSHPLHTAESQERKWVSRMSAS